MFLLETKNLMINVSLIFVKMIRNVHPCRDRDIYLHDKYIEKFISMDKN